MREPFDLRVIGLKADYLECPLGLDNSEPDLSWRIESSARGVRQSAYRIWVASSEEMLQAGQGDLWDSGRIESDRCMSIPYRGRTLKSRQRCFWRVRVWDESGQSSALSSPSWWEMGLLSRTDWLAQWLAADDALAQADRNTSLHWMWRADGTRRDEGVWQFQRILTLAVPTEGGLLFGVGRRFEKITGAWLDGLRIAETYPGHDLTRESLALPPLAPGEHRLVVEVRRKNPWPEMFFEPPLPGLALLARFEGADGRLLHIGSDVEWQTSVDHAHWEAVATTEVREPILVEPAMRLRRTFWVGKDVASARLYATALGCYEARLNGQRVGDARLSPGVSQYEKRLLYQVYDIRHLLRAGDNALGLTVADGWYASHPPHYPWGPPPRRALAQLEITYTDGAREVVTTDRAWRISQSPIRQSEICFGEIYDARLEQPYWDTPAFDDSGWQPVQLAEPPPCRLTAQVSPPIRVTETLKPQAINSPLGGVYVFDFGQNFAGTCRLHVKGEAGRRIDLRFGERLLDSGEIDQFVLLGRKAVDTYVLRGDPAGECFEPHFTYQGFRYVQVAGLPTAPTFESLEGIVFHTDLERTGRLRVDHPLIDALWRNILWTQRSNFMSVGTDCCNRAERMGYFLDMSIFWDAATFNMDVAAFTRQQMNNARDHQYATGAFAPLAPAPEEYLIYRTADGTATPGWGDGVLMLAWTSWRRYGDVGVIEQNWDAMNRHLQFILERNPNYLWLNGRGPDFGDWVAVGEEHFMRPEIPPTTPFDLFSTAHWACSAQLLAEMAQAVDRIEDAQRLLAVCDKVREAFIEAFVSADGKVGNGSQTSYVLALQFDLVPKELRQRAVEHLVADIRERGGALSTGLFGTKYILDILADAGFADLALSLLLRREYPSWGYMIDQGATTIWEKWDGSLDRRYAMASHNHYAFGSVGSFLYRRLAGIEEGSPGFQSIRVRPLLDPRIKRGGGDYDSIRGRISTSWEQTSPGDFTLEVTLPANTTAQVHLPVSGDGRIEEGGQDIAQCHDIRIVSRSGGQAIVEVGSGTYRFAVRGAPTWQARQC